MSTSQQADPLIGRLVDGRYRVRARIARGGMATVYVATDMRLERRIALKVMHGHLSDDAVFQSRFIQEARAAARLADPHVVNVFDQGQDGDMAYLVMEYLPGITLRDLLRQQRRLTVPQTMTIMDAILSGLAAAHRAGIVHRDVKPENVLLAEDGRIKIGDFGLARATTANTATGQMLLGTIAYLAPELVTRGTADARSDIYALGIMLYEMLTGDQPYKGEQPMQIAYQHATDSVPRPSVKNPDVPEALDELVLWATERSPDGRPDDADRMLERLRDIERELGIAPQVARTLAIGTAVADAGLDSGELTRTLPPAVTSPSTVVAEVDNATRLRRAARRRSAKGGWLFVLVMLLTALAGGAGWWFGSGPGSLISVAQVAGLTYDEAASRLAQDGLVASETGQYTLDVAAGQVISTDPGAGRFVEKDAAIEVFVSLGPAPHDIPSLTGVTETDARNALTAAQVDVGDNEYIFTDADRDIVLSATVTPGLGGDAYDCTNGCTVLEGDSATLTVSAGQVPGVSGLSVGSATSTLQDVGLQVSENQVTTTSDSIAKGDVIGIGDRDSGGDWRPGDTVTLIVSDGPPLFPVPNVVGMTRDEARSVIENAGFEVNFAVFWNALPDGLTEVTATDPTADSQIVKGATVYLQITASG